MDTEKPRKLAFSVENILDPTKFCHKKEKYDTRHWINGYDRDERDQLDDEQSESQSGKLTVLVDVSLQLFGTNEMRQNFRIDSMQMHKSDKFKNRLSNSAIASHSMIQQFFIHFATAVTFWLSLLFAAFFPDFFLFHLFKCRILFDRQPFTCRCNAVNV